MNLKRLKATAKRSLELFKQNRTPWPEGAEGLKVRDFKKMVGGKWEEIAILQFEFLKSVGLKPSNVFCDVGCGSFRAGRLIIPYLDEGNYLGIDKQVELVEAGKEHVRAEAKWDEKNPEIIISDSFEFGKFSKKPELAIANSVFSHLSRKDIELCLSNLHDHAADGCRFYATFFETDLKPLQLLGSHSSRRFEYTRGQMENFGARTGWTSTYIGDWNHPRDQRMMLYQK